MRDIINRKRSSNSTLSRFLYLPLPFFLCVPTIGVQRTKNRCGRKWCCRERFVTFSQITDERRNEVTLELGAVQPPPPLSVRFVSACSTSQFLPRKKRESRASLPLLFARIDVGDGNEQPNPNENESTREFQKRHAL